MQASKFPFERFEQEKQRLASLRKYEPLISNTDEDLNKLVKIAAFICQTPISLVNLIEANHTIFKAALGTDLKGSPREISFCSKAITGPDVLEIPDALTDERFKDNPLVTGPNQIRFYAGSPLVNKEGMKMGTLCVFDIHPKKLSSEQKEALVTLGEMAVMIMENRKQAAILQKGNLSAVINLESRVADLSKQLESCRKFLPVELAASIKTKALPDESVALSKDMVILQCTIHQALLEADKGEEHFSFLNNVYQMVARIVSQFNGMVHQFDGRNITCIFSEPLSTFPYEENALYCGWELITQFKSLLPVESTVTLSTLIVSLHRGKVVSGMIALPTRIDYTLSGIAIEESKQMQNSIRSGGNALFVSATFYDQLTTPIDIIEKLSINGPYPSIVYQVAITR